MFRTSLRSGPKLNSSQGKLCLPQFDRRCHLVKHDSKFNWKATTSVHVFMCGFGADLIYFYDRDVKSVLKKWFMGFHSVACTSISSWKSLRTWRWRVIKNLSLRPFLLQDSKTSFDFFQGTWYEDLHDLATYNYLLLLTF